MKITLEPRADWIVVKHHSTERVSASGLVLPTTSMPEDEGIVVAVGPDVKRCKVGERIVFSQCRSSQKGGEHQYMVRDEHVLAVVHGAD